MAFEQFPILTRIGTGVVEGQASMALDSAVSWDSSGDAVGFLFLPLYGQTSASLSIYVWVKSVTGTDPAIQGRIYDVDTSKWEDIDHTTGPFATSSDATITAPGWASVNWSSVSLTKGRPYIVLFHNTSGSPTSDYPSIAYEGGYELGFRFHTDYSNLLFPGYSSASGASDNFSDSAPGFPAVIKQGSNPTYGFPAILHLDGGANNTDWRGGRFKFSEEIRVWGLRFDGIIPTYFSTMKIYQAGTEKASATLRDDWANNYSIAVLDSSFTFERNVVYDVIAKPDSATTRGTKWSIRGGESGEPATPPTDVINTMPSGGTDGYRWRFVTGSSAASLTEDPYAWAAIALFVEDNPTQADGGGGGSINRGILTGGRL